MRDEGSGFGEGRGLGGGLVVGGGGLEGDGGLYLSLMAVGMKGGGGSPSVEVEEGVKEQGELGPAVHDAGVVGGHLEVTFLEPSWRIYTDICVIWITLLGTGTSVHRMLNWPFKWKVLMKLFNRRETGPGRCGESCNVT